MKRDELLEQALAALPPLSEERQRILQPVTDEELFVCFQEVRADLVDHIRAKHSRSTYGPSSHPVWAFEWLMEEQTEDEFRLLDEVAGPRPNVEVPVPHVLSISVDALCYGNLPDRLRHELQHPHVVDREHRRVVPDCPLYDGSDLSMPGSIPEARDDETASSARSCSSCRTARSSRSRWPRSSACVEPQTPVGTFPPQDRLDFLG